MRAHRFAFLLILLPLVGGCADTPQLLASDLQTAFERGDMDAVKRRAALDGAPADLQFFLFDQVRECASAEMVCTATAGPLDEEFKKSLAEWAAEGVESPYPAEGLILLAAKESGSSGKLEMPYAKVDGKYRLISQRYTAAKLAALRATTNEQLLQQLLDAGIYDSATGERRTDWKDDATTLPADGGEAGQALTRNAAALHAAVQAKDPDAAANSGDGFAKQVLAANGYDGKPVPLEVRKAKLQTQSLRFLHAVKVQAGWQRGDDALLLIDARNGIGWIERGAVLLSKQEGQWSIAGKKTVSYPAP